MGSLGDIIHTLPAAATLKRRFAEAEIDWVVERHWLPLVERNPHLAQLHTVETRLWRRRLSEAGTWRSLLESVGKLRRRGYDCALDFQGLIKSAVLARLSGARAVLGFHDSELRERFSALFYTGQSGPRPDGALAHVVYRNLALAAAAGAPEPVLEFCCQPAPEDVERVRATAPKPGFVLLTPSAGWPAKRWPEEHYAELALRIAREAGLPVVVNCGPGEEGIAGRVAQLAAAAPPLLVTASVGELMALVRDAALVVGGDTGPVHLAGAMGTPVVAIFGPTDPARNGPLGGACRVLRGPSASNDYSRHASQYDIRRVSVEEVFRAVVELLPRRRDGCRCPSAAARPSAPP